MAERIQLPERCENLARHTSPRDSWRTRRAPELPRRCPKLVEKTLREPQLRPNSANIGQALVKFGRAERSRPTVGPVWLVESGKCLTNLGHLGANSCRSWPYFGQLWPDLGLLWSNLGPISAPGQLFDNPGAPLGQLRIPPDSLVVTFRDVRRGTFPQYSGNEIISAIVDVIRRSDWKSVVVRQRSSFAVSLETFGATSTKTKTFKTP